MVSNALHYSPSLATSARYDAGRHATWLLPSRLPTGRGLSASDLKVMNAAARCRSWRAASYSSNSSGSSSGSGKLPVEVLERMLLDPTVQKMLYPYLPEEMRDPASFKLMLQNPTYRKLLEDMLNSGAEQGFDPRVVEMVRNFDLNSPEVQAQFTQMGTTPEQVVNKIMADPQLAAAFRNPRIQAAILDVSVNPNNLWKYSNDTEFMTAFQKMQQVFSGP